VGALAVAFGAFGAHGLKGSEDKVLEWWDTAAKYHLAHALALCAVAAHPGQPRVAGILFIVGIVLFSGSLYTMALTGITKLGMVTPIGGLCLIGGWLALGFAAAKQPVM